VCPRLDTKAEEDEAKIPANILWPLAIGAALCSLVVYLYFVFRVCVPKKQFTLWSWYAGRRQCQDYFC